MPASYRSSVRNSSPCLRPPPCPRMRVPPPRSPSPRMRASPHSAPAPQRRHWGADFRSTHCNRRSDLWTWRATPRSRAATSAPDDVPQPYRPDRSPASPCNTPGSTYFRFHDFIRNTLRTLTSFRLTRHHARTLSRHFFKKIFFRILIFFLLYKKLKSSKEKVTVRVAREARLRLPAKSRFASGKKVSSFELSV